MFLFPEFYILLFFLFLGSLAVQPTSQSSSIYEVLQSYGLPMGLFPKGVKNFTLTSSGKLEVHLDHACNAKFENELHYDVNISGILTYGQIRNLTGISAQDLFLWFPVKEIRVDIPSTGLIYFDVGVVFKQFPLSSFENPRDCTAPVQLFDLIQNGKITTNTLLKPAYDLHKRHLTDIFCGNAIRILCFCETETMPSQFLCGAADSTSTKAGSSKAEDPDCNETMRVASLLLGKFWAVTRRRRSEVTHNVIGVTCGSDQATLL